VKRVLLVGAVLAVAAAAVLVWWLASGQAGGDDLGRAERYYCPMHPTYISDRPGDCPICGMRLVPEKREEAPGGAASPSSAVGAPAASTPAPTPTRRKIVYRSTMNPNEVSDHHGLDSMGMEVVPVEVEETAPPAAGRSPVHLTPEKIQLIGVRTEEVRSVPFDRTLRTVGRVVPDERRLHEVRTKFSGWVERLHVDFTGREVRRGQRLLDVYSPELLATQEEYLIALRTSRELAGSRVPEVASGGASLLESTRRRLLLWDISPSQVERLEKTGEPLKALTLTSPVDGHVVEKSVFQGSEVSPGMSLFRVADLSRVWVLADVYEYELPFVALGQRASFTLSYAPGKSWEGEITYVYPTLDPTTRTVKVRLELPNPDLVLKPDMYGDVEVHAELGTRLAVPDAAVLHTGERDIAFVSLPDGRFEPRVLSLGIRNEGSWEVREGLREGERVVTSGNFLIDSESRLKAALAGMAP
jgi:RND family efflux transporter MFP subunit